MAFGRRTQREKIIRLKICYVAYVVLNWRRKTNKNKRGSKAQTWRPCCREERTKIKEGNRRANHGDLLRLVQNRRDKRKLPPCTHSERERRLPKFVWDEKRGWRVRGIFISSRFSRLVTSYLNLNFAAVTTNLRLHAASSTSSSIGSILQSLQEYRNQLGVRRFENYIGYCIRID
jgi:hypothetical protein